jgi:hypothetical protein
MAHKLVYAIILFIFQFLVAKNVEGNVFFHPFKILLFSL